MTDIDKAKAVLAVCANPGIALSASDRVQIANSLRAMIAKAEQADEFEAFKRDVSDAVEAVFAGYHDAPIPWVVMRRKLEPFIIAKPVDPLVAVMDDFMSMDGGCLEECVEQFRAALAKRGLQISDVQP